jgi:vanillate/3-O-methylgallate O-demethylase
MSASTQPAPSLQDAIDRAGSPIRLIWKPNAKAWTPPRIEPEYAGWRVEQAAPTQRVAISDLSHHMYDTFIEGPDATRLLCAVSANDFESFAVGQAKQFIPVTEDGHIVTDGILMRVGPEKYMLSGVPAAQNWVRYQAKTGGYDVSLEVDPDSAIRKDKDPVLFRYQVQGPLALELVEQAFGGPLPKTKFFHSVPVNLHGRTFHALRHGMAGQPGYEFIGNWADGRFVKDALMKAGEEFGMVHVGALAYATNGSKAAGSPRPLRPSTRVRIWTITGASSASTRTKGRNRSTAASSRKTSKTTTAPPTSSATANQLRSITTSSAVPLWRRRKTRSRGPKSRW